MRKISVIGASGFIGGYLREVWFVSGMIELQIEKLLPVFRQEMDKRII